MTPFPRVNVQKHPALYAQVAKYPAMDAKDAEEEETEIEPLDLPDELEYEGSQAAGEETPSPWDDQDPIDPEMGE